MSKSRNQHVPNAGRGISGKRIVIRLSVKESQDLLNCASECGLSMSEYVRRALFIEDNLLDRSRVIPA